MDWYIITTHQTRALLKKYVTNGAGGWDFDGEIGSMYHFNDKNGKGCLSSEHSPLKGYRELTAGQFVHYWETGIVPAYIIESYPIY